MELKRGFFLLHKKLRRSTFFTTIGNIIETIGKKLKLLAT
jgi:hypothetical protein